MFDLVTIFNNLATQAEIPIDLPDSDDDEESEPFANGEVAFSSGSESDFSVILFEFSQ